jgi:aspartate kinase
MALIVHKYGGTSMGSTERIKNVAKRVAKWARAGHQMVVVPSAMSGETNRLLGLAKELAPSKVDDDHNRELDMLAATGEQASSALLAIALQAEGVQAVSYAGSHREHRRRARARRPRCRQGGGHHRLPGRR